MTNLQTHSRVAWYRYDDHLSDEERYGTLLEVHLDRGLGLVHWDSGVTSEAFLSYLEPEDEVKEYFKRVRGDET